MYKKAKFILQSVLARLKKLGDKEEIRRERQNTLQYLLAIELAIRGDDQSIFDEVVRGLGKVPTAEQLSDPDGIGSFLNDFMLVQVGKYWAYQYLRGQSAHELRGSI